MKGSEAGGGRGAFSLQVTGRGRRRPGGGPDRAVPASRPLSRGRRHLPGSRAGGGERKVAVSVGRVAANEFHLERGGAGGGASSRKHDLGLQT